MSRSSFTVKKKEEVDVYIVHLIPLIRQKAPQTTYVCAWGSIASAHAACAHICLFLVAL